MSTREEQIRALHEFVQSGIRGENDPYEVVPWYEEIDRDVPPIVVDVVGGMLDDEER
jgi:hypothetical protein